MARVTIEDCLEYSDNRFQLVLTSSRRARQIAMGAETMVAEEGDKPTVIALREIAAGIMNDEVLEDIDQRKQAAEAMVLQEELVQEAEKHDPT